MIKTIQASVKMTPKIHLRDGSDMFYSAEYSEEREVDPNTPIDEQRKALFDDCFNEVMSQIIEAKKMVKQA